LKQASVSEQVPVVEGSISLEEDDEIGEGSIPFGEEEEEEEEVPEIVLEGEEDGTKV
jgi:hypothetical protein